MEVYNGIVRLEGNPLNEVYKRGLTVPEILILNKIHDPRSNSAVVKLQHAGTIEDFDDQEERERLEYMYDGGLASLHEDYKTSVKKMFSEYGPLPNEYKAYNGAYVDTVGELEEFQASEPFASPNSLSVAEERRLRKEERKKKREKGSVEKETAPAKTVKPAFNKGGKEGIQAVL